MLFFFVLLSISITSLNSSNCRESGVTYRKDVRNMKLDGDFNNFIQAFKKLSTNGILSDLVKTHGLMWNHAHFNPKFLPWHRLYIKKIEIELQKNGAKYLPYWDWSIDYDDPLHSQILSKSFFGSNNAKGQVIDSEFSINNYKTAVGNVSLIRDYNINKKVTFYHPLLLLRGMKIKKFSEWSRILEYGAHATVHSILGGKKGDMSSWRAGNDPLFWLHHAFVDKLWWEHQYKFNESDYEGEYYHIQSSKRDMLLPWNIKIETVLNISDMCVTYVPIPLNTLEKKEIVTNITAPSKIYVGNSTMGNSTIGNSTDSIYDIINNRVNVTVNDINNDIKNSNNTMKIPKTVDEAFESSCVKVSIGIGSLVIFIFSIW